MNYFLFFFLVNISCHPAPSGDKNLEQLVIYNMNLQGERKQHMLLSSPFDGGSVYKCFHCYASNVHFSINVLKRVDT